jgi:2-methylcitrate dehydratase
MPCRVELTLRGGRVLTAELADYPGFNTRGRTWEAAREKFQRLSEPYTTPALRDRIATTVSELERFRVAELTDLLGSVGLPMASAGTEERTP